MPGVKITTFMGVAPKMSPELLPDTAAQIARNAKLYSGDLLPYPFQLDLGVHVRTGMIRTLYALYDPQYTRDHPFGPPDPPDPADPYAMKQYKWLAWNSDVDIAVITSDDPNQMHDDTQRFYYTGDGKPKVSNFELATMGDVEPYPRSWYDLGLPLPEGSLSAQADELIESKVSTYERDNSNTAKIVTTGEHGLRSGNLVTISGFTYLDGNYSQTGSTITVSIDKHGMSAGSSVTLNFTTGPEPDKIAIDGTFTINSIGTPDANGDSNSFVVTAADQRTTAIGGQVRMDLRSFNSTAVEVTVTGKNSFTYFNPGPQVGTTNYEGHNTNISLSGNTQSRQYTYTWLTPWNEESIAAEPSEKLYVKEGQIIRLSEIPHEAPEGNNSIRGVNLYRTLPSASETEYYRLQTLWFPTPLDTISRTGGIVTVQTKFPHNLDPEDKFLLAHCVDTSFNTDPDGPTEVLDVVNQYVFTFEQAGPDVSEKVMDGWLYYDIAEDPTRDNPIYWGYYSFNFIDTFDSKALIDTLQSDEYDAPPEKLMGLTAIQNNILAGFVGNTVYFSEPQNPHAWPMSYARTVEYKIVGLAAIGGSLLVLTEGYPYKVDVNDPAAGISIQQIDALLPCVSKRGIVKLANVVIYPTHDGLAMYSPYGGAALATRFNYNDDTWKGDVDPTTIVAINYNEAYFATYGVPGNMPEPGPEPPLPPQMVAPPVPDPIDPTGPPGGPGSEIPGGGPEQPPSDVEDYYQGMMTIGKADYQQEIAYGFGREGQQQPTAFGTISPLSFNSGALRIVEISYARDYINSRGIAPLWKYTTFVIIGGYASEPPVEERDMTVVVGSYMKKTSTGKYSYDGSSGYAKWTWTDDIFHLYDKKGQTRAVEIRLVVPTGT